MVFLFELFSQVSDEVHGPLVVIVIYLFWQSNVIVNRIPTIISDVDHGELEREGLKNLHMEHLYKEEDSFFRQQHNRFVSCVYLVYFGVSSLCTVLCICIIYFCITMLYLIDKHLKEHFRMIFQETHDTTATVLNVAKIIKVKKWIIWPKCLYFISFFKNIQLVQLINTFTKRVKNIRIKQSFQSWSLR